MSRVLVIDPCSSSPCVSGATCNNTEPVGHGLYECTCPDGFELTDTGCEGWYII